MGPTAHPYAGRGAWRIGSDRSSEIASWRFSLVLNPLTKLTTGGLIFFFSTGTPLTAYFH
jgi:hypothetical protein